MRSELDFQDLQAKELAERTGISKRTLDGYLTKNGNEPTVRKACKIAKVLGVTVEWLSAGTNDEDDSQFSEEDRRTVRAAIRSIAEK